MEYIWANSSWQRMEAIGRQEMAYSKLARARSNCYKEGDYGGKAYGGSHHRDGHFTRRGKMGIGNFSSHAKAFDHIRYEDCCENSPCDVHKGYHGRRDYRDQNCDGLLVPNKNSFVISIKHEYSGTLLYHLPFKEFFKKFVCKEKFGKSWDFENKQSYTSFDESLDFLSKSSWKKGLSNLVLDNLFIFNSILGLYVDNILELSFGFASSCELKNSWNFKKNFDWMRFHHVVMHESLLKDLENESLYYHVPLKEMKSYIMGIHGWVLGFEKYESFQFRYPFKDCGFKACFETFLTSVFLRSSFLNLFFQILEEAFIVWNFETFSNFLFLTLQSFQVLCLYYHIPFKEVLRIDVITWMHLHDFLVHLCAHLERNHVTLL
ncbi:hypothetical protein M9H77_22681 [Catharanthus roseus]|uniref:Uncharacterized protein n=1 Tax=Catharanthus roseus TaxID=4058 RepID=A0ACC0AQV5_CATRO|nr:hypothetical protein M9H77_22681 [Catharanthus roseus]